MNHLIEIDVNEIGGGSGHGWSYWKSFLECPRRSKLAKDQRENSEIVQKTPEDIRQNNSRYLDKAMTGTLFHFLLEKWYEYDRIQTSYLPPVGYDLEWKEAVRMFTAYRGRFSQKEFQLVAAEAPLDVGQDKRIVGITPFTGLVDLVLRVDESQSMVMNAGRSIYMPGPGLYLMDHKTVSRQQKHDYSFYENSIQLNAYMMIWNATKVEPCKGMIVNQIIRTKDVGLVSHYIPYPDHDTQQRVISTLKKAETLKNIYGEDGCNVTRCFDYFSVCPFHHSVGGPCSST